MTEAGNKYVELYNSIRSISDSYSRTVEQLNAISQSMQKETNAIKESNGIFLNFNEFLMLISYITLLKACKQNNFESRKTTKK